MSREIGQKIGSTLGTMEEVDVTWGRCLRVRIHLDVTRPLERGRALVLSGKSIWVPFRYEKLPQFCHVCGRDLSWLCCLPG
jgi:hypothetical protein